MIFFTSDHHFGHENILRYCDRAFVTIEEMDAELARCWNKTVSFADTVFHLGDFTLSEKQRAMKYWRYLSGHIHCLSNPWHHDKRWLLPYETGSPDDRFNWLILRPPMLALEFNELGDGTHPQVIVLCHYPLAEWDRKHYGSWHLHGHQHRRDGGTRGGELILDVGVDNAKRLLGEYRPFSLTEVKSIMSARGGTSLEDNSA